MPFCPLCNVLHKEFSSSCHSALFEKSKLLVFRAALPGILRRFAFITVYKLFPDCRILLCFMSVNIFFTINLFSHLLVANFQGNSRPTISCVF